MPHWVTDSRSNAKKYWFYSAASMAIAIGIILLGNLLSQYLHAWYWDWGLGLSGFAGCIFSLYLFAKYFMTALGSSIKGLFDWSWWQIKERPTE